MSGVQCHLVRNLETKAVESCEGLSVSEKGTFFRIFSALLPPEAESSVSLGDWRFFPFNVCEMLLILSVGFSSKVKKECFFLRSVYIAGTVISE